MTKYILDVANNKLSQNSTELSIIQVSGEIDLPGNLNVELTIISKKV